MATRTATPFNGTTAQQEQLIRVIHDIKGERGSLMRILQEAQEIYGYLPIEVQSMIARELDIPLEKIYGVVTFYSQFSLKPKGKYQISVCMGTACYVKGAGNILSKIRDKLGLEGDEVTPDGLFSINDCRCIGACGLAPVIMINEDVYGRLSSTGEEIDGILAKYKE